MKLFVKIHRLFSASQKNGIDHKMVGLINRLLVVTYTVGLILHEASFQLIPTIPKQLAYGV